jgi:hypothetical protein
MRTFYTLPKHYHSISPPPDTRLPHRIATMRVSAVFLLAALSTSFASPIPQSKDITLASAWAEMIAGMIAIPTTALANDTVAYNSAVAQFSKGAKDMIVGFLNDLDKTNAAAKGSGGATSSAPSAPSATKGPSH